MKIVSLQEAIEQLKAGKVGVVPTDTIYGLVAAADNEVAVKHMFGLKSRTSKPGPVIAANVEQLEDLHIDANQLTIGKKLWPNPLSIVMCVGGDFAYLHHGLGDLPFRVVADPYVREFLYKTGPLATTSANHPGEQSAVTIKQAIDYFGDDVDFYVDGGDLSGRQASTIIGLKDGEVVVYREGAVKKAEIERLLG